MKHLALTVHTYRLNYYMNTHKSGTAHGRMSTQVNFFKKPERRVVSKSLKIGTANKTRMRCELFEAIVCRLP
jgi:hypothetical protein